MWQFKKCVSQFDRFRVNPRIEKDLQLVFGELAGQTDSYPLNKKGATSSLFMSSSGSDPIL